MPEFEERRKRRVPPVHRAPASAAHPAVVRPPVPRRPTVPAVAAERSPEEWERALFGSEAGTRLVRRSERIGPEGGAVDGPLASRIRSGAGGRSMEPGVRSRMEAAFGVDLGGVRVHTDSEVAPQIGAIAFTSGRDVHFAPGAYAPATGPGLHTLAHELAHVVQQGGAVRRLEIEGGDTTALVTMFKYDKEEMKNAWNFARKFGPFKPDQKFSTKDIPATVRADVEGRFTTFKDLVLDLNNVSSGKTSTEQNKARKQRRAIRRDMQREFDTIISTLKFALEDVPIHLEEQVDAAGKALHTDRMSRKPAMTGGLKKFQEPLAWPVVDPYKDVDVLIDVDAFRTLVRQRLGEIVRATAQAATALSPGHQLLLTNEQAAIGAQLTYWRNTANPVGMNADGTWGTSAGGAGAGFNITRVPQAVWRKLRAWWLGKTGAWVAPSQTSDWSLKMDQDTTNNASLSQRINYHINVEAT